MKCVCDGCERERFGPYIFCWECAKEGHRLSDAELARERARKEAEYNNMVLRAMGAI